MCFYEGEKCFFEKKNLKRKVFLEVNKELLIPKAEVIKERENGFEFRTHKFFIIFYYFILNFFLKTSFSIH